MIYTMLLIYIIGMSFTMGLTASSPPWLVFLNGLAWPIILPLMVGMKVDKGWEGV